MEMTETKLEYKRDCDFCGDPALYDGKTMAGPWAYMCEACFKKYGTGLGTGIGQRIVKDIGGIE